MRTIGPYETRVYSLKNNVQITSRIIGRESTLKKKIKEKWGRLAGLHCVTLIQ